MVLTGVTGQRRHPGEGVKTYLHSISRTQLIFYSSRVWCDAFPIGLLKVRLRQSLVGNGNDFYYQALWPVPLPHVAAVKGPRVICLV